MTGELRSSPLKSVRRMRILEKFRDYLLRKAGAGFGPDRWFAGEHAWFGDTAAGVPVNPEQSLTNATVTACVRLLSTSVASLPCYVYRDAGRSKLKAPEHPLWSILLEQPNEYQTAYVFWQHVVSTCLLDGNLYAYIQRDSNGNATGLWPLRRGTVIVEVDKGVPVYHYVWGGEKLVYPASEILHFRNLLSLNGFVGISTLQAAREGVGQALAEGQHAASLFRNRAVPGMILKSPNFLTPTQRDNLQESMQVYEGALKAGRSFILEGGFDVSNLGFNNTDSQFLESREFSVREVARWFGVPAHMVGDVTRTSYNSSEMEMLNFLMHSLRPWLVALESELYSKLFPQRTTFFPRFDATALARADTATRFEAYSKALTTGWMTVADVREAESLPFIEGSDVLRAPVNMAPVGGKESGNDSTTDAVPQGN